MIRLSNNTIVMYGREYQIIANEVWFVTPLGMHQSIAEAIKLVEENELPLTTIKAIPIAVAKDGIYEPYP